MDSVPTPRRFGCPNCKDRPPQGHIGGHNRMVCDHCGRDMEWLPVADPEPGPPPDPVNHPPHYNSHPSGVEAITICEHMNFCIGNAIKYLWRADRKGAPIEDLEKAVWYIRREIERRKKAQADA